MSRPQALTAVQMRQCLAIKAARRELVRQLKALPSRTDLAKLMNVSERTIGRALGERERKRMPRMFSIRELFAWGET